jgi:hypothetical protein
LANHIQALLALSGFNFLLLKQVAHAGGGGRLIDELAEAFEDKSHLIPPGRCPTLHPTHFIMTAIDLPQSRPVSEFKATMPMAGAFYSVDKKSPVKYTNTIAVDPKNFGQCMYTLGIPFKIHGKSGIQAGGQGEYFQFSRAVFKQASESTGKFMPSLHWRHGIESA